MSNNICVSLATIELRGTITYIKIWDTACEAVGAEGTSIALQVRRFMFSFWMTVSKSLPPVLSPFCLFRSTIHRLLFEQWGCTESIPSSLHQLKHTYIYVETKCNAAGSARASQQGIVFMQTPWDAVKAPTASTALGTKHTQSASDPQFWGSKHALPHHYRCACPQPWHQDAQVTHLAPLGCTQGCYRASLHWETQRMLLQYSHLGQRPVLVSTHKVMAGFWPLPCDSSSKAQQNNMLANTVNISPLITEASGGMPWEKLGLKVAWSGTRKSLSAM